MYPARIKCDSHPVLSLPEDLALGSIDVARIHDANNFRLGGLDVRDCGPQYALASSASITSRITVYSSQAPLVWTLTSEYIPIRMEEANDLALSRGVGGIREPITQ